VILRINDSPKFVAFARHPEVARLSQQAPATPDHVIRTKPVPMIGRDVAAFADRYRGYFERCASAAKAPKTMLDPAPRMVLDAEFGFAVDALRATRRSSGVGDHTIDVICAPKVSRAGARSPIGALTSSTDLQAKLKKDGSAPAFAGEVVVVTGAASGIGKACVDAFLRRGAAVIALDLNPAVEAQWKRPDVLGLQCDLTIVGEVRDCLDRAIRRFGGVDMLVLNAGIFPTSAPIQEIASEAWRSAMSVNVEASLHVLQACHPLLALAPRKGRVVVIGSRNVPAPGRGAAAYSASKAALTQLARVAALEWAKEGIRVNSIHPDAVYDTALWTDELLAKRAASYDMTVEQYRKKNLLRTEVSSKDVAELTAEMCGSLFAKTTAAQIPVDGGNERMV
jgi:NAD(P)-dependent dehydrogenase (short-subunit alcohol dehydrogenase family)